MKVIIQCAASKRHDAGKLRTLSGEEVVFVASPELCESVPSGVRYVRPDDRCGEQTMTWREKLTRYNEEGNNPCDLAGAAELYRPKVYSLLTKTFGSENVFILSAGWGLVRASYLIPDYDITFSNQVDEKWKRRGLKDRWPDFNHLQNSHDEPIHFFGGKNYLPMFYDLMERDSVPGKKVVHHKGDVLRCSGIEYVEYVGRANTNWHYSAAQHFAAERGHTEQQT